MFTFLTYKLFSIVSLLDPVACAALTAVTATLVEVKLLFRVYFGFAVYHG